MIISRESKFDNLQRGKEKKNEKTTDRMRALVCVRARVRAGSLVYPKRLLSRHEGSLDI